MEGVELGKLKGISLKVHPSWAIILILFTVASQGQFSRVFGNQFPIWHGWLVGLLTSLALFLSVVLLELGHYLVALNEGVKVYGITLFSFGGIKKVENKIKFEIIRQFGPSVFKTQMPNDLIDKLNNHTEQIIKDKKISEKQNHGKALVGDVAQEIRLENDFMVKIREICDNNDIIFIFDEVQTGIGITG